MTETMTGPGILRGTMLIAGLELKQRLRSRTLLVLAIVWFAVIGVVTLLAWAGITTSAAAYGGEADAFPLFSLIVYFVLLFGTLVAPAISANAINSERAGATLATTQVTLVHSWSIVLGKVLAAWATGIAFLVVALPFVLFSLALGKWQFSTLVLATLALALQIGVFTAIGVGLSALITSPLFSIVVGYLVVAAFSVGTLIAFVLGLSIGTSYHDVETRQPTSEYWDELLACQNEAGDDSDDYDACAETVPLQCETETYPVPYVPSDKLWWLLAANPYVVVADSVPAHLDEWGGPADLFGIISVGVRSLQLSDPADAAAFRDHCTPGGIGGPYGPLGEDTTDPLAGTVPVWWIGLGIELLLAGALLVAGERRVRTPARKLTRGTRIA